MSVSRTGTTPTPFGFVGGSQYQTDSDSGLMLLGHRYYDPSTGRFLSQDPIQDGDNWYAYCHNNPLSKTDPTGLIDWTKVLGGILAGAAENRSKNFPLPVMFDTKNTKGVPNGQYIINIPPGYHTTTKIDADWMYWGKTNGKNNWIHIAPSETAHQQDGRAPGTVDLVTVTFHPPIYGTLPPGWKPGVMPVQQAIQAGLIAPNNPAAHDPFDDWNPSLPF